MKRMRFLVAVLLLAGCSHGSFQAASHTAVVTPPPPGGAVSGGQVGVHVQSSSLAAVVIAGMFIAAAAEDARQERPFPSFSALADWFRGTPPPPELAPDRKVSEQDCTKPIDLSAGNLRCK